MAVPSIFSTEAEQCSSSMLGELSDVQEDVQDTPEVEDSFTLFAGVPQSTPQKSRTPDFKAPLPFLQTTCAQATCTKSPSGLAPTWTQPGTASLSTLTTVRSPRRGLTFDEPHNTAQAEMDISTTSAFDISMTSEPAADPADTSFVPYSTPSSSATGSSASLSGQPGGWHERKWIVNESKLMELFQRCPSCGASMCDLNQTKKTTGSQLSIKWECNNGHTGEWQSCPDTRGMPENNLLTAAVTLFTGATYTHIADWAGLLNLQLPQKTTYYNIQSSYLIPTVDETYKKQENAIKARLICQTLDEEEVHICGDGRSDSPGHSSKYTTYSFMDDATKQIVGFDLIQVTQAKNSVAMERMGFKKGLDKLLDDGIAVKVVTTDRHPSIRKMMREDYPDITHQFDPWHVTKGLKKKMVVAANRRNCKDLAPWTRSVSNHMWWSCSSCKGDPKELQRRWTSVLHHIRGVHRWEDDGNEYRCYHDDISADEQRIKKWLRHDSPAYKALYEVVMNTRLLNDLNQMALFKHTGQLEVFHNSLLKYCPKRLHFAYPSMQARTMLAVMDHNENHNQPRQQATTETGRRRHNIVYQKQSKQWIARPVYVDTTQKFRDELMEGVIQRRLDPSIKYRDPSSHVKVPRLAANIGLPKPRKEDVMKGHTLRFKVSS
ncbi:uncharacterized protein LOC143140023 isoform X2 [Alosa pseudoharengus]|uniref:uncharacterized protein LOC143140023 isoform X2 n=1 Tax=Alosa pseudoharengus TaxID=34774 RepID=UPI003F8B38FB